jgi:hypothetical protein
MGVTGRAWIRFVEGKEGSEGRRKGRKDLTQRGRAEGGRGKGVKR